MKKPERVTGVSLRSIPATPIRRHYTKRKKGRTLLRGAMGVPVARTNDKVVATIRALRRNGFGALDELFPTVCLQELSQARRQGWKVDRSASYCGRCGASVGPGVNTAAACPFCAGQPIAWDRIIRLGVYREPISRWIVGMKFAGQWPWAKWFGRRLARAAGRWAGAQHQQQVVVCPVPLHWGRRLRRGYDQSYLMARGFAQMRGWPVVRLIRKARYTRPQTALSASMRIANVRGSFKVKPLDLSGWTVWLVDDVKTTGATLSVCARLLRKAGADRIHVAVAAVADPAGTDFKTWPGGSAK